MAKAIDYCAAVAMCRHMGFEPGSNGKFTVLKYASRSGFSLEFPATWLKEGGTYSDEQVMTQLRAMKRSVREDDKVYKFLSDQRNVDRITRACIDFGMVYDEGDRRFYYVRDRKAVFAVDHDYIASLVCTGKASMDKLDELLQTFLETADFEHEKSREATGRHLMKRKKDSAKPAKVKGKKDAGKKAKGK